MRFIGKTIQGLILSLFFIGSVNAQILEQVNIRIISDKEDASGAVVDFNSKIKNEINTLLVNRKNVVYELKAADNTNRFNQLFEEAFSDTKVDIIIAVGALPSAVLAQRSGYSKPAIASIIIDNELQNAPITKDNTSGINNFTYVQSPFSLDKDLNALHEIYPFENIGVLSVAEMNELFPNFQDLFRNSALSLNTKFTKITAGTDAASSLNNIPTDVDAIFVFPLFDNFDDEEHQKLFNGLIEKKLPSVALLGERMVNQGAMIGYEASSNLAKIPRRIALDVSKIVEGTNASDLPVLINTFSETLVINMATVRKVGTYPNWDMMTEAILVNAYSNDSDRKLNMESTIMEALSTNLELKFAKKNPLIAEKDIDLARSELLPQLDVNTSMVVLDQTTTDNSFATKGRANWMAGSSLSQLVYAEPALANVAIQKILKEGEEYGLETTQLDVIMDAASNYLNVLQAKSFMEIQTANVYVTKTNLDIAKAKDAVGYSGATDLNRWKSELALNKIELNDAQTQFRQTKFALNEFLNYPINDEFQVEDISVQNSLLLVTDVRMIDRIHNELELDKLADFFVEEALNRLPELRQIQTGVAAQERLLLSQKRAFYLPTVGLSGGLDHTLKRWDVTLSQGQPLPDLKPSWNIGLAAQYPILQGGSRRFNQERTELSILQLKAQQADVRNQLELRVRAALQTAAASYFRVERYQEANTAAVENFAIVQDSYSQGLTNVTNLIDAQNAKVQTDLGLANANYQFILDFMALERSVGSYYQLTGEAEKNAFFERLEAFLLKD